MIVVLSWLAVTALLVLWSVCAWVLHAAVVWAASHSGALSSAIAGIGSITVPPWLAPWLPTELVSVMKLLAADLGPVVDSLLQSMPALAAGTTVVVWVVWGVGCVLLVVLGAGLHLLLARWRRRVG